VEKAIPFGQARHVDVPLAMAQEKGDYSSNVQIVMDEVLYLDRKYLCF
jgi:hypothetical protein